MSGDHVHHRLSGHGTGRDRQQPTAVRGQDCGQRSTRGILAARGFRRHRRVTGSAALHLSAAARDGVHLGAPSVEPTHSWCVVRVFAAMAVEATAHRWSPGPPRVPRPGRDNVDGFVGGVQHRGCGVRGCGGGGDRVRNGRRPCRRPRRRPHPSPRRARRRCGRRGCSSPTPTSRMSTPRRCGICGCSCARTGWTPGWTASQPSGGRTGHCGWRSRLQMRPIYILAIASPAYRRALVRAPTRARGGGCSTRRGCCATCSINTSRTWTGSCRWCCPGATPRTCQVFPTPAIATVYRVTGFTVAGAEPLLRCCSVWRPRSNPTWGSGRISRHARSGGRCCATRSG